MWDIHTSLDGGIEEAKIVGLRVKRWEEGFVQVVA
jgi:hypothetical protein